MDVSLCQFLFLFSFFEAPSDAKRAQPSPHHARLIFSWLALFAHGRPYFLRACHKLRACLHRGGGPHVGEVTCLGGVTRLPIKSLNLISSRLYDRWGDYMRACRLGRLPT